MQMLPPKFTNLRGPRLSPTSTAAVFTAGGKPSTWFPPGGLVEQSPEREAPKRTNRQANAQTSKQASERASKQANQQTHQEASKYKTTTSQQTNERKN